MSWFTLALTAEEALPAGRSARVIVSSWIASSSQPCCDWKWTSDIDDEDDGLVEFVNATANP